ncbi:hypothetical protein [uncultured Desulfosarcina sp.]|uniref:hypothetical protein n=1 Tax=uncultured Desulfosarcina sp. TaxID=218289 RepID=UPI0029C75FCC|nr:hypothetical protein [uncultured Desulfosarcina sp.]
MIDSSAAHWITIPFPRQDSSHCFNKLEYFNSSGINRIFAAEKAGIEQCRSMRDLKNMRERLKLIFDQAIHNSRRTKHDRWHT